ncbi:MAG: hypothetical protein KIT31_31505, partial [Deltaproteobacteria bacterium]|nr:hypothetical protein [Deltaproteobacteria bacterium]
MRRCWIVVCVAAACGEPSSPIEGDGPPPAGARLELDRASADFGGVALDATSAQQLTLTNTGGAVTGELAFAIGGPDGAMFAVDASACPPALEPGAACSLTV